MRGTEILNYCLLDASAASESTDDDKDEDEDIDEFDNDLIKIELEELETTEPKIGKETVVKDESMDIDNLKGKKRFLTRFSKFVNLSRYFR